MKKWVCFVVLLTTPAVALAANWEFIGSGSTGSDYFLDISSVRSGKDYQSSYQMGWVKIDASKDKTVKYRTSKVLYRAKCDAYELGTAKIIDYAPNGSVMGTYDARYVSYSATAPETVGYSILSAICWGL